MIDIGQVIELNPVADEKAVIKGDNYRFTVLTDRLIRVEYQENGDFLDEATKLAICRKFDLPKFSSETNRGILKIDTEALTVYFDPKKGLKSLQIKLKNPVEGLDVYNFGTEVENLQGTARTLDNVDGSTTLDKGIMSKKGLAVIDDSKSVVIKSDGWVEARKTCEEDYYIFAYGHDYIKCLQDFYRLSGSAPLLPRYTLGNWWSRFYPYDEAGYIKLMKEFEEKDIPISVSVIDMDWHKTQVPEKYGSGWTGYSWNKDLFPDPKRFLKTLHKMGKHITLNLHPADGVRGFEDAYPEMAKALGVNAAEEETIEFNVNDRKFMDAYFKYLHHPLEKDGVDFWWV
ncbi:MAG: alpha-xylosidase, partial [Lachnospiraceae bacterium]|nr:alpha-xylosidase [Lachnospiraceae bacterium]